MSFRDDYKKDNNIIKPRKETISKLTEKIADSEDTNFYKKRNIKYKMAMATMAAALIFSITIFAKNYLGNNNELNHNADKNIASANENNDKTESNKGQISNKEGIYVPKMELGVIDPSVMACRIATLVYKGRVYTIEGTKVTLEQGKALMDKKIGVTWDLIEKLIDDGTSAGYVDLESLEDFACIGNGDEVYTLKGYDDDFRLLTYTNNQYGEHIEIWECLNDFVLAEGSDIFGKMMLKENLQSVTWDTYINWNYGNLEEKTVNIDDTLNSFIAGMYTSVPNSLDDEELRDQLFNKESNYNTGDEYNKANDEAQKFMYFTMKDGTKIQLRLFKSGYVYYSGLNFAFKVDKAVFDNIWNKLS